MKNINIRELRKSDIQDLGILIKTRDELNPKEAEQRKCLLEWIAFHNPSARGEATYFIAEEDGRIIAHLGRMPNDFFINGEIQHGYYAHDLYVHPEYRKKGMGYFISMALYDAIEENSNSFCCMIWTSPLNLQMQRRRGYLELHTRKYAKLINPYPLLHKKKGNSCLSFFMGRVLKVMLRIFDALLIFPIVKTFDVVEVRKFDERFKSLIDRYYKEIGICSFKNINYLNWKYIDRPFNRMKIFSVQENGEILGFVILSMAYPVESKKGIIVDLVADPNDDKMVHALLRASINYFRENNAYIVSCCFSDKRFVRVLRKYLFLKSRAKLPLFISDVEKCRESEFLTNIDNWQLTYGESDYLMLAP